MKLCPFNKFKPCNMQCELYMEETRNRITGESYIVKGCCLRLQKDDAKNTVQRMSMLQAEVGDMKSAVAFQALNCFSPDGDAKRLILKEMKKHPSVVGVLSEICDG